MNQDRKNKVTIEGLMRFKRLEQPTPEFWRSFDTELRAKQLAAIVGKRPWWTSFVAPFTYVRRHPAILGTIAALLVTLVSYHYLPLTKKFSPTKQSQESVLSSTVNLAQVNAHPASQVGDGTHANIEVAKVSYKPTVASSDIQDSRFKSTGFRTEFSEIDSPAARSIAVSLAAAQASHPEMISQFMGLNSRIISVSTPEYASEPLEHVTSPSEERRARLLAASLPTVKRSDERLGNSGIERSVNNLSEDRLYQSIRRYDVGGQKISMTVKF
jgi:hypothetical protein